MAKRVLGWLLASVWMGCGASDALPPPSASPAASSPPPHPAIKQVSGSPPATSLPSARTTSSAASSTSSATAVVSPAAAQASAQANAAPPEALFPPPKFEPVYKRTAKPGDGEWIAIAEGAAGGSPVLYRSNAHPHPIKGFAYVVIVAIDLRRVDVRLIAGTLEPESKSVPAERRTGLIPQGDQADLIAVFNGGFMARHGRYGVMVEGDLFVPPRAESCTVALYRDRSVRIQTWTDLAPTQADMVAFRQTPPCIIERGVQHPELESEQRPRKWGAAENGDTEIRRSALGLDPTGQTLFYGTGEWITVKALADAMKAAGAVNAAQLDINWSYTRFLFFGHPSPGEPLQVTSTLIPKTKHTQQGYVTNASERDFFYLKRARSPGGAR